MARKITWGEPDDNNVTLVDIYSSATLYGTYTLVEQINATSDGSAKSSANTWVTSYVDSTGTRTEWYKVRFYDSVNSVWSDYSDPVTSEELVRLCTVEDVKRILNTTGRWTDDEIFNTITDVDDMLYIESGSPVQSAVSITGYENNTLQRTYYVGEENIYRVDRVFYGTISQHEFFLDDGYKTNVKYGMVRFLPVASGGPTLTTDSNVEIQYVPRIYHLLSLYRTVVRLLEQIDFTADGRPSKELMTAKAKLQKVETLLAHRVGLQVSSQVYNYDSVYGVNRRKVRQDHIRNVYIGSYGWD